MCDDVFFQISESANPVHLVISDEDARAVLDLVTKTGLCNREPADVSQTITSLVRQTKLCRVFLAAQFETMTDFAADLFAPYHSVYI